MDSHPWWVRLLLACYPRGYRERHGREIANAIDACLERERAAGAAGALTRVRLAIDSVTAALLVRRDQSPRRARRTDRGDSVMQSLRNDLRQAIRPHTRAPQFSAQVNATHALAIGANTAIFSVVNAVLMRSLPYAEPERLVMLYEGVGTRLERPFGFSAPDLVAFRERARSYDALAAFRCLEVELSGVDQPERVAAARISASLMEVLGVAPALGRTFTAVEDSGRQPVAILSDGLWRRKFNSDPSLVGGTISLDRRVYTVVGVMPAGFSFPNRGPVLNNIPAEVFVPISFSDAELRAFGAMYNNSVVARLKQGVTAQQADTEAAALAKQIVADVYPPVLRDNGFSVMATARPLREEVVGNVRRLLVVLLAAVGVLLLIACADIACLMLTRAGASCG